MQTADFYSSATGTLRVNGGQDANAPKGVSLSVDDLAYIKQGSRANDAEPVTDYDLLDNKPQINNVTLTGNKSLNDLGIQSKIDSTHKVSSDNIDDSTATNKFATAAQLEQIETNKNNILNLQQKTVTHNIITVGAGKQFQSVVLAVQSITDSSANNVYDIIIDAGTYDMFYDFDIATQTSDFVGLVLPDYVNLYGSGKENTILTGTLSGSETYAFSIDQVSPLNIFKHNIIKNLTVYGQNTRYAVHSDDRYKGETYGLTHSSECYFENCKFQTPVRSGTSVAVPQAAYGYGVSSGGKYTFKNCDFITTMLNLYVCNGHNNTSASEPVYIEFDNCTFSGSSDKAPLRFGSTGSGQKDICVIKGCTLNTNINLGLSGSRPTSQDYNCDWFINGYANLWTGTITHTHITDNPNDVKFITSEIIQ